MEFYIRLRNDTLVNHRFQKVIINGCSGPNYHGFSSRTRAKKFIKQHFIHFLFGFLVKEIYAYGGCGCYGIEYEDYNGSIKSTKWPQFFCKKEDILSGEYTEDDFYNDIYDYKIYLYSMFMKENNSKFYLEYLLDYKRADRMTFKEFKQHYFKI